MQLCYLTSTKWSSKQNVYLLLAGMLNKTSIMLLYLNKFVSQWIYTHLYCGVACTQFDNANKHAGTNCPLVLLYLLISSRADMDSAILPRLRQAHDDSMTQIVSFSSNLLFTPDKTLKCKLNVWLADRCWKLITNMGQLFAASKQVLLFIYFVWNSY